MDEFLYFLALAVGIVGVIALWRYGRTKQRAVANKIKRLQDDEENQ